MQVMLAVMYDMVLLDTRSFACLMSEARGIRECQDLANVSRPMADFGQTSSAAAAAYTFALSASKHTF